MYTNIIITLTLESAHRPQDKNTSSTLQAHGKLITQQALH